MKTSILLNQGWRLTWRSFGDEGRLSDLLTGPAEGWLAAQVPGDVHLDLMAAGEMPDPFFGLNGDLCRWVEEKDWWYRLDFAGPSISDGERVFLVFDGLDTFATVYLNGKKVATHANMFTPLSVDVTSYYRPDKTNHLAVKLASPVLSVNINEDRNVGSDWNIYRLFARKAQFNYGWDIAPRIVSVGIWQPVRLVIFQCARISDAWVKVFDFNEKEASLELQAEVEALTGEPGKVEVELELEVFGELLSPEGPHSPPIMEKKVSVPLSSARTPVHLPFKIEGPRLWWPSGLGEPSLYSYRLTLLENDRPLDRQEGNFGIKSIELVQEPLEEGSSFYFKVNGRPIFAKGFNWTPADAIPARITPERYEKLVSLVKDANANMLRVWGGGIYEPEVFYDLCDRAGILIWQDFMFACGHYPEHEDFLAEVADEAEYVVKRLRRHSCLALWSGGNENDIFRFWRQGRDYLKHRVAREVIAPVCKALNPEVPFIPDSPVSPSGDDPNNTIEGDSHRWAHGTAYKGDFYLKDRSRFVSEIGHISVPDKEVLLSFIPEDKLWPPFNEYWYYHAADTVRVGWKYRIGSLFKSIKESGLPEPGNLEEFIETTQNLQAEAYKTWAEHYASLPECGGILLWNVCDCWPQISDAVIAYPLVPKKAYYAAREVFGRIGR